MTIKKKIFLVGGIVFSVFIVLAVMNLWTHYQILENLEVRDRLNQKSISILRYFEWEKEFIRLVSDTVVSGHVSPFAREKLRVLPESPTAESNALIAAGKALVGLIRQKELAVNEVEETLGRIRTDINDIYYNLDEKISTILAEAQMEKIIKGTTSHKTALAPYVLKSLNQLTLVALNSLISREYTSAQQQVVARNKKFLTAQVHMIDETGLAGSLFKDLLGKVETLEKFVATSNRRLATLAGRIDTARKAFDLAAGETRMDRLLVKVRAEAKEANQRLADASRRNLITVAVLLVLVPVMVMLVGVVGLNRIIVRPIAQLLDAMQQVERGSYDVQAEVQADDEIGALAGAFNGMASEIRAQVAELSDMNREIKESESKYRTLVENLPHSVFLKDKDSTYISCNHNYAVAIGVDQDEVAGKTDFDFFPREMAEKYRADDARIMDKGITEELQETFPQDGREIIVHTVKTPVRDQEGRVLGVLGIFWDITERIEAEREIRESRERLKVIFDSVQTGIVIIDKETQTIADANPAALRMIGPNREGLVGRACHGVICPSQRGQCPVLGTGSSLDTSERTVLTADGRELPVMKTVMPIKLGGREHLLESFLDISKLKEAELEKDKLKSQLQQAMKMEAIGTLAGGIAHDFNNILGAIIGYAELGKLTTPQNPENAEYIDQVMKAAMRAKDLVRQILTFSRLSEQEKRPLRVDLVVKETAKLLRASLPRTIEIRQDLESSKLVLADPTQIHQVVMNLCTNAGQAMGEKGGILELSLKEVRIGTEFADKHPDMLPGTYLQLTVSDTGPGMPREVLERIFNPFYSTKGAGEGTGLGLSVAHGIVTSCGGAIYAYSEVGAGSSFKVYLPVTEQDSTMDEEISAVLPRGDERILLVDDEEALIDTGRLILESLGYRVSTAGGGLEALQRFQADPHGFDLVITDQTMPKMPGDELAGELLAIRPGLPIVICTGFSTKITKEKARAAGIRALVMKPLLSKDLAETVRKVLDGHVES